MKSTSTRQIPVLYSTLLTLLALLLLASVPLNAQEDDDDFFIFDEEEDDSPAMADPLENINRISFAINDKLYRGLLKPIAKGLRIFPIPVRNSGANFMNNLGTPVSAINALLQFDLPNTGTEISRFVINSTLGILGFFDPATDLDIIRDNEDLGQTLGSYGLGHGFYMVIPFWGPSSLRDFTGRLGNAAMNPVRREIGNDEFLALSLLNAEIALSLDQDTYESFYDSALDPYIFFRNAYMQSRAGQVDN